MAGGVEAVAGLGVIDLALHDVDEEADYVPAVVGLLADDVGEGLGVFFGLLFCGEHMFYDNGCRRLGSRGDGGERGVGLGAWGVIVIWITVLYGKPGDSGVRASPLPWVPDRIWKDEVRPYSLTGLCSEEDPQLSQLRGQDGLRTADNRD